MPLDSATYVNQLDTSIPADTNYVYEGDDHIRTLKTVLKNTFPNLNAACGANPTDLPKGNKSAAVAPAVGNDTTQGYSVGSIWVDTTHDTIYMCVDSTAGAAIWTKLGSPIASGAYMMFFQSNTAIMTGWTFHAYDQDYVIAPGATNNVGGTNNGVSADNTGWAITGITTNNTTLTSTQSGLPDHSHVALGAVVTSYGSPGGPWGPPTGGTQASLQFLASGTVSGGAQNAAAGHNHGVSVTGAWRPPTIFGTIWSKD